MDVCLSCTLCIVTPGVRCFQYSFFPPVFEFQPRNQAVSQGIQVANVFINSWSRVLPRTDGGTRPGRPDIGSYSQSVLSLAAVSRLYHLHHHLHFHHLPLHHLSLLHTSNTPNNTTLFSPFLSFAILPYLPLHPPLSSPSTTSLPLLKCLFLPLYSTHISPPSTLSHTHYCFFSLLPPPLPHHPPKPLSSSSTTPHHHNLPLRLTTATPLPPTTCLSFSLLSNLHPFTPSYFTTFCLPSTSSTHSK